jgi:hypothetical protein
VKHHITLNITSLLSILLIALHLSDDVVRGFEPGGFKNVDGILILVSEDPFGTIHHPAMRRLPIALDIARLVARDAWFQFRLPVKLPSTTAMGRWRERRWKAERVSSDAGFLIQAAAFG